MLSLCTAGFKYLSCEFGGLKKSSDRGFSTSTNTSKLLHRRRGSFGVGLEVAEQSLQWLAARQTDRTNNRSACGGLIFHTTKVIRMSTQDPTGAEVTLSIQSAITLNARTCHCKVLTPVRTAGRQVTLLIEAAITLNARKHRCSRTTHFALCTTRTAQKTSQAAPAGMRTVEHPSCDTFAHAHAIASEISRRALEYKPHNLVITR